MTSHELAKQLLALPCHSVVFNDADYGVVEIKTLDITSVDSTGVLYSDSELEDLKCKVLKFTESNLIKNHVELIKSIEDSGDENYIASMMASFGSFEDFKKIHTLDNERTVKILKDCADSIKVIELKE